MFRTTHSQQSSSRAPASSPLRTLSVNLLEPRPSPPRASPPPTLGKRRQEEEPSSPRPSKIRWPSPLFVAGPLPPQEEEESDKEPSDDEMYDMVCYARGDPRDDDSGDESSEELGEADAGSGWDPEEGDGESDGQREDEEIDEEGGYWQGGGDSDSEQSESDGEPEDEFPNETHVACPWDGCGQVVERALCKDHLDAAHQGWSRAVKGRGHCRCAGCDNNKGKGFRVEIFARHVRETHYDLRYFPCDTPVCNTVCTTKRALDTHKRRVHR
ncbi:hypothetical protein L226DRAFT_251312 [Lentinus tigrinus ALCF2SS1-7]|uniref:uncharacterized protein n=1 Tax=Lentinus tigrinus ALCF2SS1-7 TaxID=1328758 RepID=UPI0011663483|nr:hypothetical protein L226DRAFT_251312 [Lentinus tigrinus ALCF2SS1-7]